MSVKSIDPGTGCDSPVKIERSNLASDETSKNRTSAGSLLPDLIYKMSPGTKSMAAASTRFPSRRTEQSLGSSPEIEAIVLQAVRLNY